MSSGSILDLEYSFSMKFLELGYFSEGKEVSLLSYKQKGRLVFKPEYEVERIDSNDIRKNS